MPIQKILTLLVLIPSIALGQTVIKPGQSTVVTAEPCPSPTTIIIRDTVWRCPPTIPDPPKPDEPQAGYTLSYSNDYDQASDINSNQLGRGKQTTFDGRGVFWAEYRAGDPAISSGFRSEQQYNQKEANPVEGALEVEMYFKDYKATGWGSHSLQWHPNNNNSALFFLYHSEGKFDFGRSINGSNFYQNGTKPIEPNKWYKIRVEYKWSSDNSGYIVAYIDGSKYYEYKGKTQDGSGKPYLKVGVNFFNNKSSGIVLYDNLAVYQKL